MKKMSDCLSFFRLPFVLPLITFVAPASTKTFLFPDVPSTFLTSATAKPEENSDLHILES